MDYKAIDQAYVLPTYKRNYTRFVRGEGARIYDDNGKEFIDFTSGIGVNAIGHSHPVLTKALCDQASKLLHISNLYLIDLQAKLAEKIARLSGMDIACFFANSGAEANEGAIKLARKYGENAFAKKRYKVITLEHSFHGRTITTVRATGQKKMHQPHFSPYPDGFSYVPTIGDIYSAVDDETVGVLIELVQGEGGVEPLEKAEVQKLSAYLKEKGLLLIVDEVQTGVFRTGEFLASQAYGIKPDIFTLAKGLGGGVPIGAVVSRLKGVFQPGDHGSTFGGNFLSSRAALSVLEVLEKEYQSGRLQETVAYFNVALHTFYQKHKRFFHAVVGEGLMKGLRAKETELLESVVNTSHECGVLTLKAGRNTLRFLPPLTIMKEEIDEGFARLDLAMSRI